MQKINRNQTIALIPARGGSKSIPHKNIALVAGKPLIYYSILIAKRAKLISRVIVSTDDEEIRRIAIKFGAEAPFLRPKELAGDDTPDLPVFKHALTWLLENENFRPEAVVHLRPTSPFREPQQIDLAVTNLLRDKKSTSLRCVSIPYQNPFKMWRLEGSYLIPLLTSRNREAYNMPRQLLPKVLWQNGCIDVIKYDTIISKNSMTGDKIIPFEIDQVYSVDIDKPEDLSIAELLLKTRFKDLFDEK